MRVMMASTNVGASSSREGGWVMMKLYPIFLLLLTTFPPRGVLSEDVTRNVLESVAPDDDTPHPPPDDDEFDMSGHGRSLPQLPLQPENEQEGQGVKEGQRRSAGLIPDQRRTNTNGRREKEDSPLFKRLREKHGDNFLPIDSPLPHVQLTATSPDKEAAATNGGNKSSRHRLLQPRFASHAPDATWNMPNGIRPPSSVDYADASRGIADISVCTRASYNSEDQPVEVLLDGEGQHKAVDPRRSFWFNSELPNRILIDLQSPVDITEINTYSWHALHRANQHYDLYYRDDDSLPPCGSLVPSVDLESEWGWKPLAIVSTQNDPTVELQVGVSLKADVSGDTMVRARYLLFDIIDRATFYGEIDVFVDEGNVSPSTMILKPKALRGIKPRTKTVPIDGIYQSGYIEREDEDDPEEVIVYGTGPRYHSGSHISSYTLDGTDGPGLPNQSLRWTDRDAIGELDARYSHENECLPKHDIMFRGLSGEDEAVFDVYFSSPIRCGQEMLVVEVGAGDGMSVSPSRFFHESLEWRSMNIESNPYLFNALKRNRPDAKNINGAFCPGEMLLYSDHKYRTDYRTLARQDKQPYFSVGNVVPVDQVLATTILSEGQFLVPCIQLGDIFTSLQISKVNLKQIDLMYIHVDGDAMATLQDLGQWDVRVKVWVVELDGVRPLHDTAVRDTLLANGYVRSKWNIQRWCPPTDEDGRHCRPNEVWVDRDMVEKEVIIGERP